MPAFDQLQGGFTFSDTAFAGQQNPDAINIQQNTMTHYMRSKTAVKVIDCQRSELACNHRTGINGNIMFGMLEKIAVRKIAKVIPSVTAEINRSQTLVCWNNLVEESDKASLRKILGCMGEVIELPENEMGMGSELVSCMPGLIASMFDVICRAAKSHTALPEEQIVRMVLKTVSATSGLMTEKQMSFQDVVSRVATKGGITEEGTKVIYEMFPNAAEEMFVRTLEKRRLTAEKAEESFQS